MTIRLNNFEVTIKNWYHFMQSGYIYHKKNIETGEVEESDLYPDLPSLFKSLADTLT